MTTDETSVLIIVIILTLSSSELFFSLNWSGPILQSSDHSSFSHFLISSKKFNNSLKKRRSKRKTKSAAKETKWWTRRQVLTLAVKDHLCLLDFLQTGPIHDYILQDAGKTTNLLIKTTEHEKVPPRNIADSCKSYWLFTWDDF